MGQYVGRAVVRSIDGLEISVDADLASDTAGWRGTLTCRGYVPADLLQRLVGPRAAVELRLEGRSTGRAVVTTIDALGTVLRITGEGQAPFA
jgi:hypothetical protein